MFCRRYVDLIDLTGDSPSDDSASELPAITMDRYIMVVSLKENVCSYELSVLYQYCVSKYLYVLKTNCALFSCSFSSIGKQIGEQIDGDVVKHVIQQHRRRAIMSVDNEDVQRITIRRSSLF